MARRATQFTTVQEPVTDLMRPIFGTPGPFLNVATIWRTGAQTVSGAGQTYTLNVRPNVNQFLRVVSVFAFIKKIAGQGAGTFSQIHVYLNEDGNHTAIDGVSYQAGDVFSNYRYAIRLSNFIISYSKYLQMVFTNTDGTQNYIFEGSVLTEPI